MGKDSNVIEVATDMVLDCIMTTDEVSEEGRNIAKLLASKNEAEEKKKVQASIMKAQIEDLSLKIEESAIKLATGKMRRNVPVVVTKNLNTCRYTCVRQDTGEVVEDRALEGFERQKEIPNIDAMDPAMHEYLDEDDGYDRSMQELRFDNDGVVP